MRKNRVSSANLSNLPALRHGLAKEDFQSERKTPVLSVQGGLVGRVDIDWDEFRNVTFVDNPQSGLGYDSYKSPALLRGTVTTTDGRTISGQLIYDLDEKLPIELLDGKVGDLEHQIPFAIIKSITPKNYYSAEVELKSGQKIVLGDTQDVSERHTGIIVLAKGENKEYIPWKKVSKVNFE